MREVRGRRPVPRAHWLALVVVLFTITVALGLHGYVSGELTDAGRVRPPGPAGQLPESIRDGGPILGPRAGAVTSIAVPGRTVVLTFDDGPDPTWTPKVLQVLRRHEVPGTFFLLGSQMLRHPELVRQELAEGHEVGNHSFTHPDLTTLPVWEQRWQLAQAQLALVGIAGRTTALLRPPYVFSADSLDDRYWSLTQDAHANGYITVLADVDARDWERPGVDAIVQNATPKNGQGAVVLLHDSGGNRAQTVEALDVLIPKLKSEGYRFATIAEVARVPAYHPSSPGEQWRGQALVWATKASQWIASFFAVLLLVAGVLTVARMVLMLAVAGRHGRTRRRSSWGQPVSSPVSVVVPAYNEKEGIEPAVRSLLASDHPVEVVVVDDGSTDGTGDLVAGLDLPGVTLVRQENAGKPAALNAGIRAARHDLIVLVDGDTRFEPDTVRALVQPFADPDVGAVSGNAKVGNRRGLLGRWQHIEYVMGFNLDRRLYDVFQCMPTVPGAAGAFRRTTLADVGGVSDDTLAEDTDLTVAVVRAGWRVVYEEGARAWTEAPLTWGGLWKQRYRWCYGTLQAMWKHRRSVVQGGASGRFGRRGLLMMLLFQVLLPLSAPAMDAFLLYGLFFLDQQTTLLVWGGFLGVQFLTAAYAFWLDREPPWPLWSLPLQQVAYRQMMYLVVIQSVFTAVYGIRLPWEKLRRTGDVQLPVATGDRP